MPDYIGVPIETDPDVLAQNAYDYLQSQIPGWEPAEGNLETIMIDTFARLSAEIRDLASRVPTAIFRELGAIAGIPSIDGAKATTTAQITAKDTAGYTIAAGTQVGFRTAGDELVVFDVLADTVIPPGSLSGHPTLIATDIGLFASGLGGSGVAMEMVTPLDWVVSVTMEATTSGGADAETDAEYINRLAGKMQVFSNRPILAVDFSILSKDIVGIARAAALDGYNPFHNLLTYNEASIETDVSGWTATANCTVARSTAQAADGAASLAMTATTAADMTAADATYKAVTPGDVITGIASFRAAVTPRGTAVQLYYYDSSFFPVGSPTTGTIVNDTTTGWTQASATGTVPTGASYVRLVTYVVGPVAGGVHYVDKASLRRGTGTDWVPGNTPETGLERMITMFPVGADGLPVSSGLKSQLATYIDSLREINFAVFVSDPTYTIIDVTYTVRALPGVDTNDLRTRINTALQSYLSPANWGKPQPGTLYAQPQQGLMVQNVLRYKEIDQVINDVVGVDYIQSVTFGRAGGTQTATTDLSLGGQVPMPQPGTMVGTVLSA